MQEGYVSVRRVSEATGLKPHTLWYWIRMGVIPESCILRIGSRIRIHIERFAHLAASGALVNPKRPARSREAIHA